MWDDITIGKGNKGCSASSANIQHSMGRNDISENSVSYWISGCYYLNIGMTIFKDTDEGKAITKFIEQKDNDGLTEFLEGIALTKLSITSIKEKIEEYGDERYQSGREDSQEEIRKALGIRS